MAQAIWKGHISFGLVNVPVALYSAEKRSELQFQLVDSRNHARIRYKRVNEVTGEEVPWENIVRGYPYDGSYVLLFDEDFEKVAIETTRTVEITDFVKAEEIDPSYFDKPYYLTPEAHGEKSYVLLRETLRRSGRVGIAKVAIRTREYLACLYPLDNALVLNLLRFNHELRAMDEFEIPQQKLEEYRVSARELELAGQLVEAMSGSWKPEQYKDDYRDAMMKWIQEKIKSGQTEVAPEVVAPEVEEGRGRVIDIMELLRESVARNRGAAGAAEGARAAAASSARAQPAKHRSPIRKIAKRRSSGARSRSARGRG